MAPRQNVEDVYEGGRRNVLPKPKYSEKEVMAHIGSSPAPLPAGPPPSTFALRAAAARTGGRTMPLWQRIMPRISRRAIVFADRSNAVLARHFRSVPVCCPPSCLPHLHPCRREVRPGRQLDCRQDPGAHFDRVRPVLPPPAVVPPHPHPLHDAVSLPSSSPPPPPLHGSRHFTCPLGCALGAVTLLGPPHSVSHPAPPFPPSRSTCH
jgi:hypothetical protein